MNYLSVCSGIEAATVAWHHMGWNPLGFSEIEKFPSEVLKHHYPHVPNLGDMTKYKEWDFGSNRLDLLVGGTPCQSFSVAGLRKGLEDPRGNLALTYVGILDKFRPKWCVWENVPGVLSSNGGKDFGSFLSALVEFGYGFAYRVLDAQHFGVAQRRRRVFVVGCFGDWRSAAEVLFESESLRRDIAKGRAQRERIAHNFETSIAKCNKSLIAYSADKCPTITNSGAGFSRPGNEATEAETYVACYENSRRIEIKELGNKTNTLLAAMGTGGNNVPLVQTIAFEPGIAKREGDNSRFVEEMSPTLRKEMGDNQVAVAHTFSTPAIGIIKEDTTSSCITKNTGGGGETQNPAFVLQSTAVRRLTPIECERLQGFPDNYTNIKDNCPDGPRYKALGNSMAVPVMKWIGERINDKS
jgi:DNA (cytosine-5)-methyltransferase 1